MTPDEIMRMPDTQSLLIFSNQRPIKATKAFQFKLFPNADSLVELAQNEYTGIPEASQEAKFKEAQDEWQIAINEKRSKKLKNDVKSVEEEEDLQDELDQATSSKDSNETQDDVFY